MKPTTGASLEMSLHQAWQRILRGRRVGAERLVCYRQRSEQRTAIITDGAVKSTSDLSHDSGLLQYLMTATAMRRPSGLRLRDKQQA